MENKKRKRRKQIYYTYIDGTLYYELTKKEIMQLDYRFKEIGLYCIQHYIDDNIEYYQLECNAELKKIIGV